MSTTKNAIDMEFCKEIFSFRNRVFISQEHMKKDIEWIARYYLGIDGDTSIPAKLDLTRAEEVLISWRINLNLHQSFTEHLQFSFTKLVIYLHHGSSDHLICQGFVADVRRDLTQFPLSSEIFDNLLISRAQLIQDLYKRWKESRVLFPEFVCPVDRDSSITD